MGYSIFTHLVGAQPDIEKLRAALPVSLEPHVYKHRTANVWGIDVVRAPWDGQLGFGRSGYTSKDIPYELPSHLNELQKIHDKLSAARVAGPLHRGFINLSELLSATLNQRVVSVRSDDDATDYVVISSAGKVSSLEGLVGGFLVYFFAGHTSSMVAVDEEEQAFLHRYAGQVVEREFNLTAAETGLGSFDAPDNYNFVFVISSPQRPLMEAPLSPTPQSAKPFDWKRLFGLG
jgi:hypothetical protein